MLSSGEAAANLTLRCASRMSRSISEIEVPKCRWKPSCSARMPVPAAVASCARSSGSSACAYRNSCARRNDCGSASARPPNRSIASLALWCWPWSKAPNSVSRAFAAAIGESGRCGPRRSARSMSSQNLRLKRPAACGGEIDRGLELDRARRPARQRRGPLLQQAALDQQNELGAIALPGHPRGNRRRQQRSAGAGSGCDVARRRLDPRRTVHGDLQQEEALETAGVDRHRPAIGDVVDGEAVKDRAVMQRKKVGR